MGKKHSRHCHELKEEEKTVFKSKEGEVYRIPALFYNRNNKTLMAFAEKRRTKDDSSSLELVMKTATVNMDENNHEWSEVKPVKEAHLDGYRPMNPCPVYEKTSQTLFLFFICVEGTVSESYQIRTGCNKARLCYVKTTDDGQSWSDFTDLTEQLVKEQRWATFAVGPGHGLQTETGRLIVPLYAYASSCCSSCCCCIKCCCSTPHALSLYSVDGGNTWQFGKMLKQQSLECEMAEYFDEKQESSIYCNARTGGGNREEAISRNKGKDFSKLSPKRLTETGKGCQGSVVSFPAQGADTEGDQSQSKNKWLLFSHPSNKCKRIDLGVYLNKSPGNPDTWSKPCILYRGPSGYSDLAYIDDGWFACLMECGTKRYTEQIACKLFSYNEIKQVLERKNANKSSVV
ncbi:sialidase-3-like [Centropristis striata]|uniref:sialidase-3-like n=1 Tax=Centropristis striata TaxID=184440 RepID=UPI0027E07C92|nr:sialidase-3-like [Centropristis striata]